MRLLALALFALCTSDIAAIASKDASMDEQLAINAMPEAKVAAFEATTTAQAGTNAALGAKITAMCAAVKEIPVGVRPAALESACSGAKTTNNKHFGDLGEGTLLGGCQNNQSYCTINEAKCAGTGQNNTLVEGSLDCELNPEDKNDAHKGSACIDNLSTGNALTTQASKKSKCVTFNSEKAIFGVTQFSKKTSTGKNIVTKLMLAHPHKANKDIGVFAMKRMLCDDGGCSVFKAGYCVKCPGKVFDDKSQQRANSSELGKFFDCCVMGHSTYTDSEDGTDDNECPSGWTAGAFTSPDGSPSNDPLATIHADYVCTNGDDAEKAMMLIKAM